MPKRVPTYVADHQHKRRSPCCEDEAQRFLLSRLGTIQPPEEVLRLAAIGAAWDRLEMHGLSLSLEPSLWLTPDHTYQASLGRDYGGSSSDLDFAVDAAIAAATGEDEDE